MKESCFIREDVSPNETKEEEKLPVSANGLGERDLTPENYENIRNMMRFKETIHKEPHEIGAAFSNLDNRFHLDKNTRLDEGSIPSFAAVKALVDKGVYSREFIGELVNYIEAMNISIAGKGRQEKVQMVTGGKKKTTGIKSFADAFKQNPPSEENKDE